MLKRVSTRSKTPNEMFKKTDQGSNFSDYNSMQGHQTIRSVVSPRKSQFNPVLNAFKNPSLRMTVFSNYSISPQQSILSTPLQSDQFDGRSSMVESENQNFNQFIDPSKWGTDRQRSQTHVVTSQQNNISYGSPDGKNKLKIGEPIEQEQMGERVIGGTRSASQLIEVGNNLIGRVERQFLSEVQSCQEESPQYTASDSSDENYDVDITNILMRWLNTFSTEEKANDLNELVDKHVLQQAVSIVTNHPDSNSPRKSRSIKQGKLRRGGQVSQSNSPQRSSSKSNRDTFAEIMGFINQAYRNTFEMIIPQLQFQDPIEHYCFDGQTQREQRIHEIIKAMLYLIMYDNSPYIQQHKKSLQQFMDKSEENELLQKFMNQSNTMFNRIYKKKNLTPQSSILEESKEELNASVQSFTFPLDYVVPLASPQMKKTPTFNQFDQDMVNSNSKYQSFVKQDNIEDELQFDFVEEQRCKIDHSQPKRLTKKQMIQNRPVSFSDIDIKVILNSEEIKFDQIHGQNDQTKTNDSGMQEEYLFQQAADECYEAIEVEETDFQLPISPKFCEEINNIQAQRHLVKNKRSSYNNLENTENENIEDQNSINASLKQITLQLSEIETNGPSQISENEELRINNQLQFHQINEFQNVIQNLEGQLHQKDQKIRKMQNSMKNIGTELSDMKNQNQKTKKMQIQGENLLQSQIGRINNILQQQTEVSQISNKNHLDQIQERDAKIQKMELHIIQMKLHQRILNKTNESQIKKLQKKLDKKEELLNVAVGYLEQFKKQDKSQKLEKQNSETSQSSTGSRVKEGIAKLFK